MNIQILGVEKTLAGLARTGLVARVLPQVAAKAVADEVSETAKSLAPVDTGALRDSIGVDPRGVHVEVPYAVFPEFGTSSSSAQPYLRPAMDEADESTPALAVALTLRRV